MCIHARLLNDTLLWRKIGVKTMRVRFFGESMRNEISWSTSLDRRTGCMVTFRFWLSFFQIMQSQWTMYAAEWLPERSESGLVLTFFYLRLIVITYLTIQVRILDSFR